VNPKVRELVQSEFWRVGGHADIEMCFYGREKKRSGDQNNYYWGVVVPLVTAGFIRSGNDLRIGRHSDYELVHELLKDKFLPESDMVVYDRSGNVYALGRKSTTVMDTKQFMKYVRDISDWCFHHFGLQIPLPKKDVEIVDENGELVSLPVEEFLMNMKIEESNG
jgi:hypothetical protein